MKSLDDKAKAQRVVDALMRLRGDPDINAVIGDLTTLVRADAGYKNGDSSDEHHNAFTAIQALREGLDTGSADVQERWQDALAKARVWLSSFVDATLVNALQRRAAVVLQKSIREGFGLTVTEAMWKGAAVVGGMSGAYGGRSKTVRTAFRSTQWTRQPTASFSS